MLGGRYSSGTAPPAAADGFALLPGRSARLSSGARLAGAAAAAAASCACLRSAERVSDRAMFNCTGFVHTLLGQSLLLVCLQALFSVLSLHSLVRPRLCKVQAHLLPEEVEALKVVDRILRAVHTVVDDEGLSLALETLLRDDFNNVAEVVEESMKRVDQGRDLDVLVEVADLLCLC